MIPQKILDTLMQALTNYANIYGKADRNGNHPLIPPPGTEQAVIDNLEQTYNSSYISQGSDIIPKLTIARLAKVIRLKHLPFHIYISELKKICNIHKGYSSTAHMTKEA